MQHIIINKPQTEADILKLAKKAHFDIDKLQEDANSPQTIQDLKRDIDNAYKMGINGTPTTVINGKDIAVGVKTYKDLKEWVKKYGAEEK